MLWVVIIIAALFLIVILLLPTSIIAKLSGVAVGVGMIFTAYGLYLNSQAQRKDTRRRQIDRDNDYWMRIFSTFITQPNLQDMHQQIYGDSVPVAEHSMFSMMMQVVENVVEGQQLGIMQLDDSWRAAVQKWVSHPMFGNFWRESNNEFSIEAQNIIRDMMP